MGNKDFFKDLMKKENKWKLILALLLLVLLYMSISFFTSGPSNKTTMAKVDSNNDNNQSAALKNYEEAQKIELKNILREVQGIGNVEVMISFESGETKVPAMDSNTQSSTTEETDKEGGKRVTNQKTDGDKVVMSSSNGGNEPLIVKTYKPKITGVMVVAEGADDSKVKYDIAQAVSTLYGIGLDKVNVYPMKK
ncbi:stage III sporulation protein AG [Inconstantimicrobium mannanitabidum]|uniref:Stage III sporulation protein AG n=1 Tax=Inconstantimicrobium mannanitabidum TaxID=1604901 RepID=A0ACB5RB03_9CLOT|nr:stage III sporulation protein AG [Clostridium sp. TW13]GKX66151.1 stage III sporulation protein AG [Clostridium sp. TW13]